MVVNGVKFGKRSSTESSTRKSIERQARKWLVRMDGDAPLADWERKALKEWMSRSAFHAGELTRLARLWSRANVMTELLGGLESQQRERRDSRKRSQKKAMTTSWTRATLVTASAILSSVVLVYCGLLLWSS